MVMSNLETFVESNITVIQLNYLYVCLHPTHLLSHNNYPLHTLHATTKIHPGPICVWKCM